MDTARKFATISPEILDSSQGIEGVRGRSGTRHVRANRGVSADATLWAHAPVCLGGSDSIMAEEQAGAAEMGDAPLAAATAIFVAGAEMS